MQSASENPRLALNEGPRALKLSHSFGTNPLKQPGASADISLVDGSTEQCQQRDEGAG